MTSLFDKISQNLIKVKTITEPYGARIIAVTKYYGKNEMVEAYNCGIRDFGESRAIEAVEKINSLEDKIKSNSSYHFIGHLQTNKVKKVIGVFDFIHSIDGTDLALEISKEAQKKNVVQKILIQVNNANEQGKFGIAPSQLNNTLSEIQKYKNLEVTGLMNIAPLGADKQLLRKLFRDMYKLKEEFHLKELSMGMSLDFQIALEEGATMIRLGKIIFE